MTDEVIHSTKYVHVYQVFFIIIFNLFTFFPYVNMSMTISFQHFLWANVLFKVLYRADQAIYSY